VCDAVVNLCLGVQMWRYKCVRYNCKVVHGCADVEILVCVIEL
jgi:hypothetical protein